MAASGATVQVHGLQVHGLQVHGLQVHGLQKSYDKLHVLKGVDFDVVHGNEAETV